MRSASAHGAEKPTPQTNISIDADADADGDGDGDADSDPGSTVPCDAGMTVVLAYEIEAAQMWFGASDDTGPGRCVGDVTFRDSLDDVTAAAVLRYHADGSADRIDVTYNGATPRNCDNPFHCATVVYGSGETHPEYCTVWAYCDPDTLLARAVGFTW